MALKLEKVPESIDFPKEEENILRFWKDIDVFHSCLKQSKNKPRLVRKFFNVKFFSVNTGAIILY